MNSDDEEQCQDASSNQTEVSGEEKDEGPRGGGWNPSGHAGRMRYDNEHTFARKRPPMLKKRSTSLSVLTLSRLREDDGTDDDDDGSMIGYKQRSVAGRRKIPPMLSTRSKTLTKINEAARRKEKDEFTARMKDGDRELHQVVRSGNLAEVKRLVSNGAKLDVRNGLKQTPLHVAFEAGRNEIATHLLENGADLNAEDLNGLTPVDIVPKAETLKVMSSLVGQLHNMQHEQRYTFNRTKGSKMPEPDQLVSDGSAGEDSDMQQWNSSDGSDDEENPVLQALRKKGTRSLKKVLDKMETGDATHYINKPNSKMRTAIHYAAKKANASQLQLLLDKGGDPDCLDESSQCPLHIAAAAKSFQYTTMRPDEIDAVKKEMIQALLEKNAYPERSDKNDATPLHIAAKSGNTPAVSLLLSHNAERNNLTPGPGKKAAYEFVNKKDKKESTPLHLAAANGHLPVAKILLDHGADATAFRKGHKSTLHLAAGLTNEQLYSFRPGEVLKTSKGKITELLLNHGADPTAQDANKSTPLHEAAKSGILQAAEQLLNSHIGSAGRKPDSARTPKRKSSSENMETRKAPDFVDVCDSEKNTALHYAVMTSNVKMVDLLLRKGADPNARGVDSNRPIHMAASLLSSDMYEDPRNDNIPSIIDLLIAKNADLNAQDIKENSVLHIVAYRGHASTARKLLTHKIKVNLKDNERRTPLIRACKRASSVNVVEVLIENEKIDLMATDKDLNNALHLLISSGILNTGIIEKILTKAHEKKKLKEILNPNKKGNTPLFCLVKHGTIDAARHFIDHVCSTAGSKTDKLIKNLVNAKGELQDTPLHCACSNGNLLMVKFLLRQGADVHATNGKQRTPLHVACDINHLKIAGYLISKNAKLNVTDKDDLTPLKVAVSRGNFHSIKTLLKLCGRQDPGITLDLIEWGGQQNDESIMTDLLNRELSLPIDDELIANLMHEAAKNGYTETIKALMRWKPSVVHRAIGNGSTPLHPAAEYGRTEIVRGLIKAKAEIDARNTLGRTPLHQAAAKGKTEIIGILIQADANKDCQDNDQTTPLHLACQNGHLRTVQRLIETHGVKTSCRDKNGCNYLDYAIDNKQRDITAYILGGESWKDALSAVSWDQVNSEMTTPMRKLIKDMPEIAMRVLDQCIEGISIPDVPDEEGPYSGSFLYLFIDDTFSTWVHRRKPHDDPVGSSNKVHPTEKEKQPPQPEVEQTELFFGRKINMTKELTKLSSTNHPLNVMVSNQCVDLLEHPVVSSLLDHKWNHASVYFFLLSLISYVSFLIMLTGYTVVVPPTYFMREIYAPNNVTWFVDGDELWRGRFGDATVFFFGSIGHWIIIVLSIANIIREVFQMRMQKWLYFYNVDNWLEVPLYVLAIIFVMPISDVTVLDSFTVQFDWQWQCGALAVFLAWIDLILFIRRLPVLGIYINMFIDIFRTFLKFVPILILFITAFALAFYVLLMNQQPFHYFGHAFIKTFVMMIGEADFTDIFHGNNYLGTENTLEDNEKDYFLNSVFYDGITYAFFTIFFVVMSILIMNLLVGLAVDDIKLIKSKATLHRLRMQVEMVLEIEQKMPPFIWKSAVIESKTFKTNTSPLAVIRSKVNRKIVGNLDYLEKALVVGKERKLEVLEHDTSESNDIDEIFAGIRKLQVSMKDMNKRMQNLDTKLQRSMLFELSSDDDDIVTNY